ncbi:unnamed protein product [Dibothriocephalus latus]|uniref:BEACH domain-containing protein n=1 Tax=Dibothriocephalus latus TaxID=60516 RepID=A0A3P6T696_DIBLA|nr:unnamed protein product [Dibothriocephalus latus]
MLAAAWIIFLFLYALLSRATTSSDGDPSLTTVENASLSPIRTGDPVDGDGSDSVSNASPRVDIETQTRPLAGSKSRRESGDKEGLVEREDLTATEKSLFKMTSATRHGIVLSWHVDTLWRYMAFTNWPAIARLYNVSLTDHRLVIFEPIYLSARIPADEAIKMRPPSDHFMPPPKPTYPREPERESGPQPRDVTEDDLDVWTIEKAIGEQLWAQIASFGRKESLAALGKPLSGLLNWTSHLWTTIEIALASLLGSCFFFTITCVGMLIVHRTVSCTCPCAGDYYNGQISIIAATLSGQFSGEQLPSLSPELSPPGSSLSTTTSIPAIRLDNWSRSIRVWSVDCGHLVAMIDRYSREAIDVRNRELARKVNKYAAVWSMKLLPTGELVAGCSDGTLERAFIGMVWDPRRKHLRQVLDLRSCTAVVQARTPQPDPLSSGRREAHLGGITSIEMTKENWSIVSSPPADSFFVGSSAGYVGMVRFCCGRAESDVACLQPIASQPLLRVSSAASTESLNNDFDQHYLSHAPNSVFFVVSGSEDGSLTLIETHKLHFQRFSWDPSPILCVDLCHFTIGVGQASGRLHLLKTCFLPSSAEDRNSRSASSSHSLASNLESGETVFQVTHYEVDSSTPTISSSASSMKDFGGHCAAIVWVKLFPLASYSQTSVGLPEPISPSGFHLSLSLLRLVTCSLDGTVSVWRLDSSTSLLKRFRTNSPTFALPAPVLAVDERVIIGDQGYLRLIDPWSTQCERSIQLLPPSDQSSGATGSYRHSNLLSPTSLLCLRRWASGLGPVGVADGSPRSHYIVSLADGGRTLVVVPKSAFVS